MLEEEVKDIIHHVIWINLNILGSARPGSSHVFHVKIVTYLYLLIISQQLSFENLMKKI